MVDFFYMIYYGFYISFSDWLTDKKQLLLSWYYELKFYHIRWIMHIFNIYIYIILIIYKNHIR